MAERGGCVGRLGAPRDDGEGTATSAFILTWEREPKSASVTCCIIHVIIAK